MDSLAHTTPASRQALREYLRNRRLTRSVHQATMALALDDLEEAMRLLRGVEHPSLAWAEEIEAFLACTDDQGSPSPQLPGLADFL